MYSSFVATMIKDHAISIELSVQQSELPYGVVSSTQVIDGVVGLNMCNWRHSNSPNNYVKFYHKSASCRFADVW